MKTRIYSSVFTKVFWKMPSEMKAEIGGKT